MGQAMVWILGVIGVMVLAAIIYLLNPDKVKHMVSRRPRLNNSTCEEERDSGLTDYSTYVMSRKEKVFYLLTAGAAVFITGYIFYHSVLLAVFLTPAALLYLPVRTRSIIKKRKEELTLQFKEALYSLSASLAAGKSLETAFRDALKDLSILYPDPDTFIIKELECLVRKLEMNETVESTLEDFAQRSHIEDIHNFVEVLRTCKRTGGNLVQVMKNSSDIINDKIVIKQEIGAMLAQRKLEQKILNVLPIGMIFLLSTGSEEFMKPIFTELSGRVVMTVSAVLLVTAYFISERITNIEV